MLFPAFIVQMATVFIRMAPVFIEFGAAMLPGSGPISAASDRVSGTSAQVSGISGTVYRLSGNHMPSPNRHAHPYVDSGRTSGDSCLTPGTSPLTPSPGSDSSSATRGNRPGVKATVCIFELTSDSQVVRPTGSGPGGASRSGPGSANRSGPGSPYYKAILTHLIRQVDTDDKGFFQVALPPGTYSVFTKKNDLFYATQRDENNNIAPVKVLPGKITRIQCSVESDHSVVY